MNIKTLKTLEYNKIIDQLTDLADSKYGKELCQNLIPLDNLESINLMLDETTDAQSRILKKGSIHFNGIHDIRPSIGRMKIGSFLNIIDLLHISSILDATLRIKSYGGYTGESDDEKDSFDSLASLFAGLEPLSNLNNEIKRCIISEDEIADDASSTLKNIRRSIKNTNDKIQSELSKVLSSNQGKNILQENIITMRNGRYCLPVKSEYKNQFQGMVHDQSSTGSTFFIEPLSVVKLNNEIRELSLEEEKEIEKILQELSIKATEYIDSLETNYFSISQLDFIFARAYLSNTMKGTRPILNKDKYINIKKARHPLINKNEVVPIDVTIGKDYTLLIITGPNTGGKTVSLKTVGLLTLMGQSGLHIPAFDNSELSIFKEVYADIGDEQSIEQSLSTFSSHMTNIVKIIQEADEDSLVLFDELGAGTDPTEGAALAISILSYLHNKNIRTLATTHYSELKVYALSTKGVINASCEFDIETLRPTYKLLIGVPGKSNAFAISSKLGLPDFIIEDANNRIGIKDRNFEDLMAELETNRIKIEAEKNEINKHKLEIEKLRASLNRKTTSLEAQKTNIIIEAKEEARKILDEAKDFADDSIRKYNKWIHNRQNIKDMEEERAHLREKVKSYSNIKKTNKAPISNSNKAHVFKIGDEVHVVNLGLDGNITSLPNSKNEVYVQMGILSSLVSTKDLVFLNRRKDNDDTTNLSKQKNISLSKSLSIKTEINLLGKTVDEALAELDKYLDDAYLSKLLQVRVIHGRGTGALKSAIHTHLKRIKYVKEFHLAHFNEGGDGVTVVHFK